MEKILTILSVLLKKATVFSAEIGAGSQSTLGTYQPQTPKSLIM